MNAWSGASRPGSFCMAQRRFSGKARSFFRANNAATAIPLAKAAGSGAQLWIVLPFGSLGTN